MPTLHELREARIAKKDALKAKGIVLYPSVSKRNIDLFTVEKDFETLENSEKIVAGKILTIREHGKMTFLDIKDHTGKLQIFVRSENITADYAQNFLGFEDIAFLDIGDYVEISGTVVKTKTGQISILAQTIRLLAKSLRPMPSSWDGLEDKETRMRKRYLDTQMNEDSFQRFIRRSQFWEAHRDFFKAEGFIEMNIPTLEHTTGGADANPFITHIDTLDEDVYLRISQELFLKRLIGGGYHKVFEIGPRFRNEGISDEHLPEHMAMECYWAYADEETGMQFIENLFKYVYNRVYGTLQFNLKGNTVDLAQKWKRIDFSTTLKERFNIDPLSASENDIKNALVAAKIDFNPNTFNISRGVDMLWKQIRTSITGPAFMVNEPKFLSPLAKSQEYNPAIAKRFHPIIAGSELGNGFSELNDPIEQLYMFLEQQKMREGGDAEAHMLDMDYVEMLEYGMPPTFGYGHSERNFWIFEGVTAREGVPFPLLKRPEHHNEIDDLYKQEVQKFSDSINHS
jgi:lysyl-tRNA synthetase class 2